MESARSKSFKVLQAEQAKLKDIHLRDLLKDGARA